MYHKEKEAVRVFINARKTSNISNNIQGIHRNKFDVAKFQIRFITANLNVHEGVLELNAHDGVFERA